MKDFLGNEIRIGDLVANPRRVSSSLWMTVGKVLDIQDGKLRIEIVKTSGYGKKGSVSVIHVLRNVVKLGGTAG